MLLSKPRSWKLLLACLLAVGLLLPATMSAQAASATVTGVKVTDGTGTLKVDVNATGAVNYRTKRLSEPRAMVVVDVWPATLSSNARAQVDVNRGLVEKVRLAQYTPDTVRVYVDVISQPEFKVSAAPGKQGLTLAISTSQIAEAKATTAPAPQAQETARPAPAPRPRPAAQAAPAPRPAPQAQPRPVARRPVTVAQAPTSSASALRPQRARPRPPAPQKTVNLDFVNADLVYVIKILAKEMGRNVFVAPDVAGSVTVTLNKVPPEGALALILKMQETDYGYKIVDNTIIVATPEKLDTIGDDILRIRSAPTQRTGLINQEFLLENAPAAKIIEFLKGQFPDVEFTQHPTMNGFFARGTAAELRSIKSSLGSLDVAPVTPPPPRREFIPVKYGAIRDIQNLLKTFVPDLQITPDERLSLLIVEGSDAAIEQAQELLATLDRPLDQVMLDVKVIDLSEQGSKNLGVTWGSPNSPGTFTTTFAEVVTPTIQGLNEVLITNPTGGTIATSTFVPSPGGPFNDPVPGTITVTGGSLTGLAIGPFSRSPFVLQSTLAFLVTNNEAKILASPRVATQTGKQALIHVGDKFPIVFFDPRAGQFQVTYVDIGIKLNVKPDVKADGYIMCEVQPEVSNLVSLVNNQYPRTTVRTVNSTMRIKDGDTMILGGLIREDEINNVSKIPLLGDLPIFGVLFRSVTDSTSRNEVVLMMTPHIMK